MNSIPEVLRPLVEFEEEDGPLIYCSEGCNKSDVLVFYPNDIMDNDLRHPTTEDPRDDARPVVYIWQVENLPTVDLNGRDLAVRYAHAQGTTSCPHCHAVLGYAPDDRPYRIRFSRIVEALAHRDRALEIMAEWYERPGGSFDREDCITQARSAATEGERP